MVENGVARTLGIGYLFLVALQWIFLFIPYTPPPTTYYYRFMISPPGLFDFLGCLFLIPSAVLIIIFLASPESTTIAKSSFGIGVPAWIYCFIGGMFGDRYINSPAFYCLIVSIGLILIGFLLLWRIFKIEKSMVEKEFPKGGLTIVFGLIYVILSGVQWSLLYLPYYYDGYVFFQTFAHSPYGWFVLGGCGFLFVSAILMAFFFISEEGSMNGKLGFILGLPGWILCFGGSLLGLPPINMYTLVAPSIYTLLVTFGLTIFGSLLLWRAIMVDRSETKTKSTPTATCPRCGGTIRHVPQYDRYYCDDCQRYV